MSVVKKGTMKVGIQDESGITLTKDYGFTLEEAPGSVKAFDFFEHPEYGNVLLLNSEILFLKFWTTEQLTQLQKVVMSGLTKEMRKRNVATTPYTD